MLNIKELNKAILEVCLTKYKKDAKEAHAFVEGAGFVITKANGQFEVKCPSTGKSVIAEYRYQRILVFTNGGYGKRIDFPYVDGRVNVKFDFYHYLISTRLPYRDAPEYQPTKDKYRWLKSAKWDVEYYDKRVWEIQQKMESLQKDLIRISECRADAKTRLNQRKSQLGLK